MKNHHFSWVTQLSMDISNSYIGSSEGNPTTKSLHGHCDMCSWYFTQYMMRDNGDITNKSITINRLVYGKILTRNSHSKWTSYYPEVILIVSLNLCPTNTVNISTSVWFTLPESNMVCWKSARKPLLGTLGMNVPHFFTLQWDLLNTKY